MSIMGNNTEELLNLTVSGFHQYVLCPEPQLSFVSQNLCGMVGFSLSELTGSAGDRYGAMVHPADREVYREHMDKLKSPGQSGSAEYRLIKKDGSVIWVRDAAVSASLSHGTVTVSSVLTDITELKRENENLRFLNDTIPCGFVKYTCEKQPRVTYINSRMMEILRSPEPRQGESDYMEMYKNNILLMVPMEERNRFVRYLDRVCLGGTPVAGELTLLRMDGTRARVFGWVIKTLGADGKPEFQSACVDITQGHKTRRAEEAKRYLNALSEVYDKIFEVSTESNTVKCLHCSENSSLKKFEGIGVRFEDALEKWLLPTVEPEYREAVADFFTRHCHKMQEDEGKPPQIGYRGRGSDGTPRQYTGIFITMDRNVTLYCSHEVRESEERKALRDENALLKEGMKDLMMRFSDGIAAFEVLPDRQVKPLYASDNVCRFFGYTGEQWLSLTKCYTPLEDFVKYSDASYEDFDRLLRNGEAEFTYLDCDTSAERKIKAVCSRRETGDKTPGYVMLYAVGDRDFEDNGSSGERGKVSIRTFGYFDVFVGGKPIAFRNKKSKELFALLVDRRGGYVTSEEAIGFLWEEEPVNAMTLSRYRKVALRLKNTLEEYGISDVVETVDGKRRIVMEKVRCDLYDYLSGREEYARNFKGSYLTNYSWGEITLGELTGTLGER